MTDGEEVHARLAAAAEARQEQERLQRRLAEVRERVAAVEVELAERRSVLEVETEDVEKLESFSPARIWAGLKGSHAGDHERETAEREAARYAVAEAEARLAAARSDQEALQVRLTDLGDVEGAWAAALHEKERWLAAHDPGLAARVGDLALERGRLRAQDQENREAYDAGCRAGELLAQAADLLGGAGSWATWDTFGGGGMFTDMMKYQQVDRATAVLREADRAVQEFSRELADTGGAAVPSVPVDSMMRTLDVFLDNIFTDLAVRNRISDASARVAQTRGAVDEALRALRHSGQRIAERLREIDAERERLLS